MIAICIGLLILFIIVVNITSVLDNAIYHAPDKTVDKINKKYNKNINKRDVRIVADRAEKHAVNSILKKIKF